MVDTKVTSNSGPENKRKSMFDASKLPKSNDPAEILKQVEFYFSDANFPRDKFLWETAQKHDGWVPIATIHNFARMKRFPDRGTVVEALRSSPELLEVSEDGNSVRRKAPLQEPEANEKMAAFERSIYAKGFGEETETLQYDIEVFFQQYGKLNQVRLRRTTDGVFKGSVFVEFANIEDAKKFLESDPKPSFKDSELLTMSKHAYVDMKSQEQGFTAHANGRRRKFNGFRSKAPTNPKKRKRDERKPRNDDTVKLQKANEESVGGEAASKTNEPTEESAAKNEDVAVGTSSSVPEAVAADAPEAEAVATEKN